MRVVLFGAVADGACLNAATPNLTGHYFGYAIDIPPAGAYVLGWYVCRGRLTLR